MCVCANGYDLYCTTMLCITIGNGFSIDVIDGSDEHTGNVTYRAPTPGYIFINRISVDSIFQAQALTFGVDCIAALREIVFSLCLSH